jgi:pimeloyl-ACP methyl ester carboxylesterase
VELVVNGRKAFAGTGGRPFDPRLSAVVFLHGAGVDRTAWALQTRALAHGGRAVLAPDLPGHGRSDGPPLATVEAMADWVAALLDAAHVAQAALVGFSMGSLVALEAAARFPDRARALVMIGVARRMDVHPDLLAAARANDRKAIDLILSWSFAQRGRLGGNAAPGLWMKGGAARLFQAAAPGVLGLDLKACDDYQGADAAAERIKCPTLVVWGEKDHMTPPRQARELAQRVAGARERGLPGAGHLPMMEDPIAVTGVLKEFV